jgi:hypothetical protein
VKRSCVDVFARDHTAAVARIISARTVALIVVIIFIIADTRPHTSVVVVGVIIRPVLIVVGGSVWSLFALLCVSDAADAVALAKHSRIPRL